MKLHHPINAETEPLPGALALIILAMIVGLCWKLGVIPPAWIAGLDHLLTQAGIL